MNKEETALGSIEEKYILVEVEATEADYMIHGDLQDRRIIWL